MGSRRLGENQPARFLSGRLSARSWSAMLVIAWVGRPECFRGCLGGQRQRRLIADPGINRTTKVV